MPKIERTCQQCGKIYKPSKKAPGTGRLYCSRACSDKAKKGAKLGDNHHSWVGGREKVRDRILIRQQDAIKTLDMDNNYTIHYLKRLICGKTNIRQIDVPSELVELKRAQLKLTREIRNEQQKNKVG